MSPGLRPPSLFRCATHCITLGIERLWFALIAHQPGLKDLAGGALSAGVIGVRHHFRCGTWCRTLRASRRLGEFGL
jgi:hypothetical protein